jgi:hypothetical protein
LANRQFGQWEKFLGTANQQVHPHG